MVLVQYIDIAIYRFINKHDMTSIFKLRIWIYVISCGRRQCYIEPWWWVEGAAGAIGATPLSIPQGITIWPKNKSTSIPPIRV